MNGSDIERFIADALKVFGEMYLLEETYQKVKVFLAPELYELTSETLNNQLEDAYNNFVNLVKAELRYSEDILMKDSHPYWMYECNDGSCNEKHQRFDRLVYRWDDPVWTVFYPPNSWNCTCRIRKLTRERV